MFIRCSDCDIELVDYLPPKTVHLEDAENPDYVAVATVSGPLEEGQICSFLQANGIPARPQGRIYGTGLEAVRILVPREMAADALDLLAKADHGELGIDDGDITRLPDK